MWTITVIFTFTDINQYWLTEIMILIGKPILLLFLKTLRAHSAKDSIIITRGN